MARNRFLRKCDEMKKEMNRFKNEYGISSILYDRLAKYGIVTMNILCNEVEKKSDLRKKFQIFNDNQCNLLWSLIQQIENNDNSNASANIPHGMHAEGDGSDVYNTPYVK
eukprot:126607_1